jgi:hypothetical protein
MPAVIGAMNDEGPNVRARTRRRDLAYGCLPGERHPRVDSRDVVRETFHCDVRYSKRRVFEDASQSVRVRASDLVARVPPKTRHVDELGITVKDRRQCIGIASIPRFHEHDEDILRSTDWFVTHGESSRAKGRRVDSSPPHLVGDRRHRDWAASTGRRWQETSPPTFHPTPPLKSAAPARVCAYGPCRLLNPVCAPVA